MEKVNEDGKKELTGPSETGSLVAVQFVLSSIGVLLTFISGLMNAAFSVLFFVSFDILFANIVQIKCQKNWKLAFFWHSV